MILFGNSGSIVQYDFLVGPGLPHRIYAGIKEEVIEELFKMNSERLKKKLPCVRVLLIFDDSLSRKTVHSDIINRIFIHGRIFHLCPLIIQQSISQVHTDWRRNCDIFFLFKPRTLNDKQWVFENLLSEVETKQEAFRILNAIPKHTALCVDFTGGETKQFLYQAPKFVLKSV